MRLQPLASAEAGKEPSQQVVATTRIATAVEMNNNEHMWRIVAAH
jgi:hypothetical protein